MQPFNQIIIFCVLWIHSSYMQVVNPPAPPPPAVPPVATKTTTTTTSKPATSRSAQALGNVDSKPSNPDELFSWLMQDTSSDDPPVEYEGYDGWYNNLAHPNLGAAESPLIRLLPPAYSDGSYQPSGKNRPNPIKLSEKLMKGKAGRYSKTGKTAFLVFFGQQVVEEILDAQRPGCPPEYINIPIPDGHEYRHYTGLKEMPVLRSAYDVTTGNSPNNPRQQLNEITPWLDGGLIYGTTKGWADTLRTFGKNGEKGGLLTTPDGRFPAINTINLPMANPPPPREHELKRVSRFFRLGNPRGNENPFLLTFGVLWFRWHNEIARFLARKHQDWNDERVFNEARKWVIATQQHIVVNNWLPEWLGQELPPYRGYDGSIDPAIAHVFQSAAMRFGHTLVPSGVYRRSKSPNCTIFPEPSIYNGNPHRKGVRTCNSFWNPQEAILKSDIDELLMGLASQPCEEEDNIIVEDLRGRVFGPLEFSRRDLMAINIQRGRDHGLPDYKTARRVLGLEANFKTFKEMGERHCKTLYNKNPELFTKDLAELYKDNTDDIDIWVGGLLETEDRPGELFRTIISNQFQRIRDGDRFWFENRLNGLFTEQQVKRIKNLEIGDIVKKVTDIRDGDIQRNPFRLPSASNSGLSATCLTSLNITINCSTRASPIPELCHALPPLGPSDVDECTTPKTFDYFSGSELSFVLTYVALVVFTIGCFILLWVLAKKKQKELATERKRLGEKKRATLGENSAIATEWIGPKQGIRQIIVQFHKSGKCIKIRLISGQLVRTMDLRNSSTIELQVSASGKRDHLLLRMARDCDLVLQFDSMEERGQFIRQLEDFLGDIGVGRQRREVDLQHMLNNAVTKMHRQKQLEKFFRVVFAQAFSIEHDQDELLRLNAAQAREVISTELTPYEFAEAMSLKADSLFVQQMFALVDKDEDGYISFREFLDVMVIFAKGTPEEKAKLMFDLHDIDHSGVLTIPEFSNMIKSMLELANQTLSNEQLDKLVTTMFRAAGIQDKTKLTFDDFVRLLGEYKDELGYVQLNFDVEGIEQSKMFGTKARQSAIYRAQDTLVRAYSYSGHLEEKLNMESDASLDGSVTKDYTEKRKESNAKKKFFQDFNQNRLQVFWGTLYTLFLLGIFAERAYYYSVEREHGGLRRIAGYGVTITRGAASAMMFTYSTLLLTMCRNLITLLRETFLHRFVPFDSSVSFHKYVAFWALAFTIMHIIGHAWNFYCISSQPADDLTCLFRDFYHATHELPKFHYWCYQTITGLTGVLLVLNLVIIYVFAQSYARHHVFNVFWATHNTYPVFYILMFLHGFGRLVQDPFFYYFFLGPCVIFVFDRLVSVSRKTIEISVVKAELLPSDVTMLELKRPYNFEYKSGQWVRIACPALNSNEYHPFTLSSSPYQESLTLHIRAVGPWTRNLRRLYDPENVRQHAYPKICLDGPYGEGHQDWFRYEVSVLVGGGIGVTPFASILKDISYKTSNKQLHMPLCKKVYFLWVTRTQKHFEWLIDIIREVEDKDSEQLVKVHIFVTQFYQKFDLRTTMLYICERHFQKISKRSLFTGLKSVTHFGRPDFFHLLNSIQNHHSQVDKIGVFSCGPPPMTSSVQKACEQLNRQNMALFVHHYENF